MGWSHAQWEHQKHKRDLEVCRGSHIRCLREAAQAQVGIEFYICMSCLQCKFSQSVATEPKPILAEAPRSVGSNSLLSNIWQSTAKKPKLDQAAQIATFNQDPIFIRIKGLSEASKFGKLIYIFPYLYMIWNTPIFVKRKITTTLFCKQRFCSLIVGKWLEAYMMWEVEVWIWELES